MPKKDAVEEPRLPSVLLFNVARHVYEAMAMACVCSV